MLPPGLKTDCVARIPGVAGDLKKQADGNIRKPHWATFAHGRSKQRGVMNKLEADYARHLDEQKAAGIVAWWRYECITLVISHGAKGGEKGSRITVDFFVMLTDGTLEAHETKGFRESRQVNALKSAAELYPFRFILVEKVAKKFGGGWKVSEV